MCTVTWQERGDTLRVYVNRDEKRVRLPAQPALIQRTQRGTSYLAPVDADRGGTWAAVNEYGICACLLNYYQAEYGTPVLGTTRGELPVVVMDARTPAEADALLTPELAAKYKAFLLLVLAPGGVAREYSWDGLKFQGRDMRLEDIPVTTSSYETTAVTKHRKGLFDQLWAERRGVLADEDYVAYHLKDEPGRTAFGVCMRRPDTQTVSFTRLTVTPGEVRAEYRPVKEGRAGLPQSVVLGRANPGPGARMYRVCVETAEAS